jgi:hypothetical protein
VFRGGIFRYLLRHVRPVTAAIISSLLFGALHISLYGIVPLSLLGLVLCFAYYTTGSIRVPIAIHIAFNLHTILIVWFFPEAAAGL